MSFPPYTAKEKEVISCLNDYQNKFTSSEENENCPEIHILMDSDGKIIDKNQVSSIGGYLTSNMELFAKEHLCCLIHNHPSNNSLSQSDWNVLSNFPKMTMVAVNSQGSTFRGKVILSECFSDWGNEINNIYYKIDIAISNYLTCLCLETDEYYSDILSEIAWFVGVHIGCTLSKKGYVDYEPDLKGKDYYLWHQPKHEIIHKKLEYLCNSTIP